MRRGKMPVCAPLSLLLINRLNDRPANGLYIHVYSLRSHKKVLAPYRSWFNYGNPPKSAMFDLHIAKGA